MYFCFFSISTALYSYYCATFANMKLHVFNTEHDLALAFGSPFFTPPHAARQLRADLGFLPALMAEDGDIVLVDDVDNAANQLRHIKGLLPKVHFVTLANLAKQLRTISQPLDAVCPWGWDAAVCRSLVSAVPSLQGYVPTSEQLDIIRQISNRCWAAGHLGNSGVYCTSLADANRQMESFGEFVLKSPWSCSGRGVRYRRDDRWVENVIRNQGGIMVEPYYNKVMDFAMEFYSDGRGVVSYQGLSLFETVNGAYKGNLLASDAEKQKVVGKYIRMEELNEVRRSIINEMTDAIGSFYKGPFGVDMMVYEDSGQIKFARCVELNLRSTMGHVALALTRRLNPGGTLPHQLMRVEYDGNHYHLRVLNTRDNALNTTQL